MLDLARAQRTIPFLCEKHCGSFNDHRNLEAWFASALEGGTSKYHSGSLVL